MLIDSHIHFYSAETARDPASWAEARGETYWLSCVAPEKGHKLQGWPSLGELLSDMDDAGIEKAIILGWYWENPDTCYEQNEFFFQLTNTHSDRLYAMASFNALGQQVALDDFTKRLDQGFLGIGELNPPAQGYAYNDPWLDQALNLVATHKTVANFHVTEPAGHNYPGKIDTPFSELQKMAARHKETKFVFAHLGGLLPIYELNETARQDLENVYYDTAAIPLLYDDSVYQTVASVIGPKRILFGSDYPLRTFPKQQESPGFTHHINQIENSGLDEFTQQKILGQNAQKLFKL